MHYPRNRLTDLMIDIRNTHYEYDDAGNLIKDGNASYEVEENDKLVQFIFNHDREVVAEKQDDVWRSYIRESELLFSSAEHARTYYHYASDEMGSITHITDGDRIVNEYSYDAWGDVVSEREEVSNRFKFNGQQLDPITGQYYLRARYYNPVIGRFTQEDTYRGDGLNLYAYCGNNPVYYVDPTGHDSSAVNSYQDARDGLLNNSEVKRPLSLDLQFFAKKNSNSSIITAANKEYRKASLREIKRQLGIPMSQQPIRQKLVALTNASGDRILNKNKQPIMTRELTYEINGKQIVIQDHSIGHDFGEDGIGNQPSHHNVRPVENTRTGKVEGMKDHYYFNKRNNK